MSEQTSTPRLTDQFAKAMVYAEQKHHTQVRKGGDIPYVGHLLSVAGLADAYRNRGCTSWMVDELERVVDELKNLVES